ncbi:hypothetical protein PF006_g15572 [Phytophthora fragariae]|uniref:Uncharacterized protein n=1 Tax=Phytophthora fragariae TaxID=53985 RepID=A0A6A3TBZ6_9STRA|nr:hypothetical protein PF006_g15572 [Phytophthora fragariae]
MVNSEVWFKCSADGCKAYSTAGDPWKQRSEREHGSQMKRHLLGHMKEHYLLDHVKKRHLQSHVMKRHLHGHVKKRILHRPQKRGYLHGQPTIIFAAAFTCGNF